MQRSYLGDIMKKIKIYSVLSNSDNETTTVEALADYDKKEKIIKDFSQIQGTSINQIARVTKNTFFYIKKCWN